MNLHKLPDDALISKTESLVGEERKTLTQILHHMKEIERRRLFSELGYKSIFDFAVRRLGYTEDQAYRRISAMRLLKELPQIEQQIVSGELSLTNIALAQKVFRQKAKNHASLVTCSSAPKNTASPSELTSNEKIEKLKGRFAHKYPRLTLGELFEKLCDEALENSGAADQQCEICSSHYALEVDHIVPKAKGGASTFENLRLLCRPCNQRAAINEFGQLHMDQFLN